MKSLASSITISFLLNFSILAEDFTCVQHSEWPNERSFAATIKVSEEHVTVSNLQLSESWPLPKECDSPLLVKSITYNRNMHIKEISFGPYSDNECSYFYSLKFDDEDLALLHVVRSAKVWGEKPFLARCTAI